MALMVSPAPESTDLIPASARVSTALMAPFDMVALPFGNPTGEGNRKSDESYLPEGVDISLVGVVLQSQLDCMFSVAALP